MPRKKAAEMKTEDFSNEPLEKPLEPAKKPVRKTVKKEAAKPKVKTIVKKTKRKVNLIPLGIALIALVMIVAGLIINQNSKKEKEPLADQTNQQNEQPKDLIIPEVKAKEFAQYSEYKVSVNPKIEAYTVKSDFSNVENYKDFSLSKNQKEKIVANNFVVDNSENYKEFFDLYNLNAGNNVPSFITTDSILHNYHLVFDYLLKNLEKNQLADSLKKMSEKAYFESQANYEKLKGTDWENAGLRNLAFFNVAAKIFDDKFETNPAVESQVSEELVLITEAKGPSISPTVNLGASQDDMSKLYLEDYSQYIPRGHYNESETLQKYFKAMMWYGRISFRVNYEDELKSSILLTYLLKNNSEIFNFWDQVYEPIGFFVGRADDLNYYNYSAALDSVYGNKKVEELPNAENLKSFSSIIEKMEAPKINSIPIADNLTDEQKEQAIKSFRLLGQRFTIDAQVFQNLMYPNVKENANNEKRVLPKALDIPAALGASKQAYSILQNLSQTGFSGYDKNLSDLKEEVLKFDSLTWTQNLYWSWLYTLMPLTEPATKGYPSFMTNDLWQNKDLNTYISSWTELKHDTLLYAKQPYGGLGGGPNDENKDDRGYVEPRPYLYSRLASLLDMTQKGLDQRDLLSKENKELIKKMQTLAMTLKEISEKELNLDELSDKEYEFIKTYGNELEVIWLSVNADYGIKSKAQLDQSPAALITDVATDPNGSVLEEGTGDVFTIYTVVPLDGKLRIAKGAVFSHYEFSQPIDKRLTDEEWRKMVSDGKTPELDGWVMEYMAE